MEVQPRYARLDFHACEDRRTNITTGTIPGGRSVRQPPFFGSVLLKEFGRQSGPVVQLGWRVPRGRDPTSYGVADSGLAHPEIGDPVLCTGDDLCHREH
jgi:hypothetical protein